MRLGARARRRAPRTPEQPEEQREHREHVDGPAGLFRLSCRQHFPLDSFIREDRARVGGVLPMPSQQPVRLR